MPPTRRVALALTIPIDSDDDEVMLSDIMKPLKNTSATLNVAV